MCGKLPWKLKMSMLDASWCIEWLTVYDLTELVLCCLLTVGNATSGGGKPQASLVIFFPQKNTQKKNTLHLASLWHESPTSGAWRVNMSEHCQTQTQSQQAVYRTKMVKTGNQWKQCQLVSKSTDSIVYWVYCFVRSLVYMCASLQENLRQNKTWESATIELALPWESAQGAKVPQLLLAWPWCKAEIRWNQLIAPSLTSTSMVHLRDWTRTSMT